MVAYNFKAQFADDVEDGRKRQTIRAKARCKPGDKLQLYTGMRTKKCRKLKDAVCKSVHPITITALGITIDGKNLHAGWARKDDYDEYDCDFAGEDGFEDFQELAEFFCDNYGLPFNGFVIKW